MTARNENSVSPAITHALSVYSVAFIIAASYHSVELWRALGELRAVLFHGSFVLIDLFMAFAVWRPFEISVEGAALRIARGFARDRTLIAFPWQLVASAMISRLLSAWLRRKGYRLFRASHRKGALNSADEMTDR